MVTVLRNGTCALDLLSGKLESCSVELWMFYGAGWMSWCWDAHSHIGVEKVSQLAGWNSSLIYSFGSCSEFTQYFIEKLRWCSPYTWLYIYIKILMYMKIQPSFVKYKKDKVYNCPSKKRIFAFLHISSPSWKDRNRCGYLLTDSDYIK